MVDWLRQEFRAQDPASDLGGGSTHTGWMSFWTGPFNSLFPDPPRDEQRDIKKKYTMKCPEDQKKGHLHGPSPRGFSSGEANCEKTRRTDTRLPEKEQCVPDKGTGETLWNLPEPANLGPESSLSSSPDGFAHKQGDTVRCAQ